MKLIVGLGNPGGRYEYTYHNAGFLAVDIIADALGVRLNNKECESLTAVKSRGGDKIILAKPQTFMNLSGKAVKQLVGKYGGAESLTVIYDDIDIEKGSIRCREKGSAGTHNGMRSIIEELGHGDFARVRIGTGPVPENTPLVSYVLQQIPDEDRRVIAEGVKAAAARILSQIT